MKWDANDEVPSNYGHLATKLKATFEVTLGSPVVTLTYMNARCPFFGKNPLNGTAIRRKRSDNSKATSGS